MTAAAALVLCCVLRVSAGDPKDAPHHPTASEQRGATTLEFWAMGREGEAVRQLATGFEAREPGVRVRVQTIPWSAAHEKILTAFVAGALPDALQVGSTWIPELAMLGAIEALASAREPVEAALAGDYFPGALATGVVDGQVWALPWYVDTRLLFYRADLLRGAGYESVPKSWPEWRAAMASVAATSGPGARAVLLPLREWETPVILAMQAGSSLLRDGDTRGDFQSPAFREAFSFYLDLFSSGLAPKSGAGEAASVYQGFAEGRFSFVVTGPWNLREFADRLPPALADAWATAPMPAPAGRSWPGTSLAGGASLAVVRGSPRRELARRWIDYLCEPSQLMALNRMTGSLPARPSAWSDASLASARASAFRTQLASTEPPPRIPEWERIAARIGQHAEAAIRGIETPDEALAALDADTDLILEKRRWILEQRGRGADDGPSASGGGEAAR